MNKDQVTGKVEKAAGRVKQGVGEALETWGNVKDAAAVTADRHHTEAERKADDARAGVREKVDEIHENVNEKIDAHKANERNKVKSA